MSSSYRSWAEISRAALRHNAAAARSMLGANVALLAVIKANGYGHGLTEVAKTLAKDAHLFGVANLPEAIAAREAVPHPVIILGPALPEERTEIAARGFIPSVSNCEEALAFRRAAPNERPVEVNCAIDTGMGRMGVAEEVAIRELKRIAALPNLHLHSVSTHLPVANEDAAFTRIQLARFQGLAAKIRQEVPGAYKIHVLPSAGVMSFGASAFEMVRAGLMLYGSSPLTDLQNRLRPALTLKTRVALLRELPAGRSISYGRTFVTERPTRVATLAVGYADGLPRSISGRGAAVLIRGERCPVLGRVTMDLTMVDVTQVRDVSLGDEVVLIGRQGDERIFAAELARQASSITWEIFTGIGSRVARVYL